MTEPNKLPKCEVIKCSSEELAKELESCKPMKLFGSSPLPKGWNAQKAVAQMNKVSKHSQTIEEAMRGLGLK